MPTYAGQEIVVQSLKEIANDAIKSPLLVSKKLLVGEPDCQSRKWFDYRFMSPICATRLFARQYEHCFLWKWEQNFDRASKGKKRPLNGLKESKSPLWTSLWKARQMADLVGMPYLTFIEYFMDNQLDLGVRQLPRPNQFIGPKAYDRITTYLQPKWQSICSEIPRFSTLPAYHNDAFVGSPDQLAHHDHLISHLRAREGNIRPLLEQWCFSDRILPIDRAQMEFPGMTLAAPSAGAGACVTTLPAYRSCFGLPHASGASETCASCPQQTRCRVLAARFEEKLETRLGFADPVDAEKRRMGRERVQRHRFAKKAATL